MAEKAAERWEGTGDPKVCFKTVSSKYRSGSHYTQEIQTIHKAATMEASGDIWVWMGEISCYPSLNEELLRQPIKE